jgi:peroxiredoxin
LGASLVAICPQTPERNAATQQKLRLEFSVLSDHANAYARSLRLVHELPDDLRDVYRGFGVDLPESNGEDSWTLPFPTRIVVDRTGLIRDVQSDPDYTRRPEPADTVEILRSL